MGVTIELLIIFAATLAVISVLSSALIVQKDKVQDSLEDYSKVRKVRDAARTVEIWMNNGMMSSLDFYDENISFRIEGGRFFARYEGKVIEVEGVFLHEDSEPI